MGNTTSDGIVRSTGMDRYNVKLSGEAQLHDNWTTGFNGNFVTSKIKKQGTANDGVTATVYTAPISYTMAGIPSHIEGDPILRIRSVRTGSMMETGRATIIALRRDLNVSSGMRS